MNLSRSNLVSHVSEAPFSRPGEDAERDRQAIRAVARGSGDAVSELYDRYGATVYGLALRVLGQPDLAEEVVQDVFAQVWREAGRYDTSRSTVAGWIVMLTRTRAIDRLRARKARPDLSAPVETSETMPIASPDRTPETSTIVAEDTRLVRGALARLPDQFRSLVELAYYEGLTHSEIAARTGIPLGTVKTRLRNAMGTLRSALA
ncbi:MAG TPA: sigma-70 family RNA polymerase sigma factor [Vicinamibacterales bacterium]|nr:sigma-70 family RNA polymerase sigma factor [Vicinamibacterales bacterium]